MKNSTKKFLKTFGILSALTLAAGALYIRGGKSMLLKSADGKFYIRMPHNWKNIPGELNPGAVIEIADREKDAYLVAIPYGKKKFAALKDFYTYFMGVMKDTYQDYNLLQTESVSLNSKQGYVIKGTLLFEDIFYESRVYTVEYDDIYLFVMTWTPADDAVEMFPEIEKIVFSLRRV